MVPSPAIVHPGVVIVLLPDAAKEVIEVAGLITAVSAASIILIKYVIRPIAALYKRVSRALQHIESIWFELGRNGGRTIRDAVDRLEVMMIVVDQRAKIMLQDVANGIIETDELGNVTWANKTYLRIADRSLDEMSGDGWVNAIHPDDRDRIVREWKHTVADRRDLSTSYRIRRPDGIVVRMRANVYRVGVYPNKTMGWVAIAEEEREDARERPDNSA